MSTVVDLTGAGLRLPAMLRIWCEGHHIRRIEEYLDPTPLDEWFANHGRN